MLQCFTSVRPYLVDAALERAPVARLGITYGESTHNEMCFFVGFAVDRTSISACDLGQSSGTMTH
jgi:hypothetical protein